MKTIIRGTCFVGGFMMIVIARSKGIHLTEGELIAAYWPWFLAGPILMLVGGQPWKGK